MKKLFAAVLATAFIVSIAGCSTKSKVNTGTASGTKTKAAKKVVYKDGTYDVLHKSSKPGYEEAVVTIKNKKIQKIVLKRLDDKKKEVNYNQWDGTHNGYPNLKKFRVDLANAMMKKQSPDVNVISGATASSNGWKAAVSSALSRAQ